MHLRLRSIQQLNAEANSMARKQSSVLEDLFAIAATLPWWVGVALAITSYLFFHSVAVTEIAPTAQIGQMGSMVIKNVFKTLSDYFAVHFAVSIFGRLSSLIFQTKTTREIGI